MFFDDLDVDDLKNIEIQAEGCLDFNLSKISSD